MRPGTSCPDNTQQIVLTLPTRTPVRQRWAVVFSVGGHALVGLALLLLGIGQSRTPDVTVYQIALVGRAVAANAGMQAQEAQQQGEATAPPPPAATLPPKPAAPPESAAPTKPALSTVPQRAQAPRPTPQRVRAAAAQSGAQPSAQPGAQSSPAPQTPVPSAAGTQAGQSENKGEHSQEQDKAGPQAPVAQAGQQGQAAVYTVQQVDRPPAIVRRATPTYPPEARKKALEGRVVVRLVVDAKGQATQCAVHRASPEGHFEAAALEAVSRMRFAPGEKAGRAVSTLVLLPFDFRLRK